MLPAFFLMASRAAWMMVITQGARHRAVGEGRSEGHATERRPCDGEVELEQGDLEFIEGIEDVLYVALVGS